ncbi:acyltransferase [Lineolata rhizophorae]|uniref:Acyltransferase n=1 Tax=Lineolata rhizophorae TaxID=578093 RepID=A0A6A6P8D9_9PEZI|nr:acyltransferase [Lineolata rhizophorae]
MGNDPKNVKWVEGLRGIASFLVIMTHLTRAWDPSLFSPADSPDARPRLLQLPVLRIPWQGRVGVTIFAFLTGFVCAIKPLRLARSRAYHEAFSSVGKSAFRRPPRLVLPAGIAMCVAWGLAQLGAFTVARRADSAWIREASPFTEASLWGEVRRLWRVFLATWTNGHMDYDDHQWALLPLLKGSMMVYVVLAGTIYVKFRFRVVVYLAMLYYWHQNNHPETETFGQQLFFGMLLSDAAQSPTFQAFLAAHKWPRKIISPLLVAAGLYFASYPNANPEWRPWSNGLLSLSRAVFPPNVNVPKRYTALGVDLVILGLFLSPTAKEHLASAPFLYLGRHSFAVYLIHGTLLRTVLVWMLYGVSGQPWELTTDDAGTEVPVAYLPRVGSLAMAACVLLWLGVVYACAHAWTTYVDAWCARVTQRLEAWTFEEDEKRPLPS